ncbi:MAG: D-aminoacyl-tRNA deacylase [Desulfobulbaceae bacterium]
MVQRVKQAEVRVGDRTTGRIGPGLLVLAGVAGDDGSEDVAWMAEKLVHLRIFEDEEGLMNRSLLETGGEMLIVSQFTLLGDCRKGRRPSWSAAAPPGRALELYTMLVHAVREHGVRTATGEFQAMMDVELINSGPVTLLLDSRKNF